jgi:molybdopterin-containing oxidoreductase family iron-sulfur binding subunit
LDGQENARKWHLSRRRFLQIVAAAGAGSAIGAGIPSVDWNSAPSDQDPSARAASAESEQQEEGKRLRKWMMIIDLRKCDGCQSQNKPPQCTEGCIQGHFVPEPMQWIEVYEHELAADAGEHDRTHGAQSVPVDGTFFVPTPCMHCQNPPCVNVCPVGATWSTPEGVVLIDQDRCIGCRMCMAACPYERRFFTWGQPQIPVEALFVERSPLHQVPLEKGVVAKCDFCPEMLRSGRLPFCATACPQSAIYFGDFEEDRATNGEEVVKVSRFLAEHPAVRMKEELGTRPRVYYIPGYGELAGRDPKTSRFQPVRWEYKQTVEGGKTWRR